ncbi:MAG TPA: hypothetical protein VJ867_08495 [Gemmatimonadaceae bacterium]|nr:hypothetical protein [Gemmatimonadaceae bacterium]
MKKLSTWILALGMVAIAGGSAHAQRFGGQLSWGSDSDLGIGARAEFDLTNTLSKTEPFSKAFVIGQFDYYFIDCGGGSGCSYWELNPSLAVPFKIQGSTLRPYAGAGLNIAHASVDLGSFGSASNTDTGINLLGGLKFPLSTLDAFTEARVSLGGGDQFALSFGLLFGGAKK